MREIRTAAYNNRMALFSCRYPGSGLVIGLDQSSAFLVMVYWLTDNNFQNQNRVFDLEQNGTLRTVMANPSELGQANQNLVYTAMAEYSGIFVVSNGSQTDTALDALMSGHTLYDAALGWTYHSDAPHYTPRITAASFRLPFIDFSRPAAELSIVRRSIVDAPERHVYSYRKLIPGIGHCLTTYMGDGDPLPSFQGEPFPLLLNGGATEIGKYLWAALSPKNRVAMAVKMVSLENGEPTTHIINEKTDSLAGGEIFTTTRSK